MKNSNSKTNLKQHKIVGKKMIPPLANIGMTPSSWIDNRLPEMLWATLLTNAFSRKEVLRRFSKIIDIACGVTDKTDSNWKNQPLAVTMSGISNLDEQGKKTLMMAIAQDEKAVQALGPMLLLDNIPARNDWESILKSTPTKEDWNKLAEAIAGCFFHQSQKATDCRWIKALYSIKSGQIGFTKNVEEVLKLIYDYPNHTEEEMRYSRPTIRSLEISLDNMSTSQSWSNQFWDGCRAKTGCIVNKITKKEIDRSFPSSEQLSGDRKRLHEINQDLSNHFWKTNTGSSKDSKHEVAFGIAMYTADLATSSILLGTGRTPLGRMVLRCLVESFITFKYLIEKNDPNLWSDYQSHGMGQAKLVIQRSEEENRVPEYLNQKSLGQIANDDVWVEFLPINLGSWDESDLRKRAIDVGLKNKYDDYYTWPSSFSHGQWGAIRETVYDLCGNPLHKFHKIPVLFSMNMNETREDIYLLLNEIVKLLYDIYPR